MQGFARRAGHGREQAVAARRRPRRKHGRAQDAGPPGQVVALDGWCGAARARERAALDGGAGTLAAGSARSQVVGAGVTPRPLPLMHGAAAAGPHDTRRRYRRQAGPASHRRDRQRRDQGCQQDDGWCRAESLDH